MIEIIFWLFFAYITWYYFSEYLEKRKSPPGPLPIPILGNLVQVALASDIPSEAFVSFAKRYGEIFQLRMGMKTLVVPASVEAINTVYSRSEAIGRDLTGSWYDRNFKQNLGIVFSDGPLWEETRTWTMRNLRDYGFGKSSSMESAVLDELDILFEKIDKTRTENKNIVHIPDRFVLSTFKIMYQMIAGHMNDQDEIIIADLLKKSELALSKGVFGAGLVTAYPFVRFLIPETTGHAAFMDFFKHAHKAARDLLAESRKNIAERKKNGSFSQPETFVEAFVIKSEEERGRPNTIFMDENFVVTYLDLLQAGSDTNSAFLEAFVLFMTLYPDVQAKIVEEIEQFGPKSGKMSYADKQKMIYCQATMWEVHRHAKVVQNLVPRRVTEDFYYKKYLLKKGTIMVANLENAYMSEDVWEDPTAFKPERFIGKDGQLQKLNCLMPFGVGKRICPGELLSHITGFLYITSILKRYKLSIVPGQPKPRQEMNEGITSRPFPFEVLFTDR